MAARDPYNAAARIIRDAGGELVGRTRLQKIAFLLELAGLGEEFSFDYRHYGPFSEDLAQAMDVTSALGAVKEDEKVADWGGRYSIYTIPEGSAGPSDATRAAFIQRAKQIGAVELELAATAAYLFSKEGIGAGGVGDPWQETRRRKPGKAANGRLESAARAYEELRMTKTARPLPSLPAP
jgi:uncharacterized protein